MSETQSIGEAVRSANTALTAKPDAVEKKESREPREREVKTEREPVERNDAPEGNDWAAPKWSAQWSKNGQAALKRVYEKFADDPERDQVLPVWAKEIESRYESVGKTQAELDKFRKRWEPYDPIIGSLEQRFAMQGVHPAAGLQQMAAVSDLLQRDPDQALAFLAQQFRPRDAKRLIEQLSQAYGVDLQGMAAQAPWVDPAVKQLVEPLEQQNRQLMAMMQAQHQQQYTQAAQQVAGSIQAFKTAKDETGELKYPHFDRLQDTMAQIVNVRGVMPLETLYDAAMKLDPELFEKMIEDRARKAEARAVRAAQSQNAEVEKAVNASRNVNGTTKAPVKPKPKSTMEAIKAANKRLTT